MSISTLLPFMVRLDPARQQVFKQLAPFSDCFVLAGGTAIMLQIGHRLSYDFDCFSETNQPANLLRKIKGVFGSQILLQVETGEQITFKTSSGVEVTFTHHPYPLLQKPIKTASIPLFHLDDLAANKAYTIGRRGAWRDYVDLFILLRWELYDIFTLIKLATRKFTGEFNDKLFLEQLCYFKDVELVPTKFLKKNYTADEIKSFLEQQVESYVKKILG